MTDDRMQDERPWRPDPARRALIERWLPGPHIWAEDRPTFLCEDLVAEALAAALRSSQRGVHMDPADWFPEYAEGPVRRQRRSRRLKNDGP